MINISHLHVALEKAFHLRLKFQGHGCLVASEIASLNVVICSVYSLSQNPLLSMENTSEETGISPSPVRDGGKND